ncbi:cysteine peptidase family C39 domain-containing protein [Algoriphagus hitonicola]|uniref:Peptidase C39 family protein n=1 Tax=Algoriphagus hitonicola TaxID=435880 RepID=A0A1I2W3E0_9BACT|nr:Peptidase C39 family protein [Algoriphagus hitonicola]
MENSLICIKNLFELINVPFTTGYLKKKLLTHPEPESLLAISDILAEYNLESLAIQLTEDKLDQLPLPCVVSKLLSWRNGLEFIGNGIIGFSESKMNPLANTVQ